jgi:hypothetical protein
MDKVTLVQSHLTERDFEAFRELADRDLGERCIYGHLNLENHTFSSQTVSTTGVSAIVSTHNYPLITQDPQSSQSYIMLADGRIEFYKGGFNIFGPYKDSKIVLLRGFRTEVDREILENLKTTEDGRKFPSLYMISEGGPVLLHLGGKAIVFDVGVDPDKLVHEVLISHGYSNPLQVSERRGYVDVEETHPPGLRTGTGLRIPEEPTTFNVISLFPEELLSEEDADADERLPLDDDAGGDERVIFPEGAPDAYVAPILSDDDAGTGEQPPSLGAVPDGDGAQPPSYVDTGLDVGEPSLDATDLGDIPLPETEDSNRRERTRINLFPFNDRLSAYLPALAHALGTSRRFLQLYQSAYVGEMHDETVLYLDELFKGMFFYTAKADRENFMEGSLDEFAVLHGFKEPWELLHDLKINQGDKLKTREAKDMLGVTSLTEYRYALVGKGSGPYSKGGNIYNKENMLRLFLMSQLGKGKMGRRPSQSLDETLRKFTYENMEQAMRTLGITHPRVICVHDVDPRSEHMSFIEASEFFGVSVPFIESRYHGPSLREAQHRRRYAYPDILFCDVKNDPPTKKERKFTDDQIAKNLGFTDADAMFDEYGIILRMADENERRRAIAGTLVF